MILGQLWQHHWHTILGIRLDIREKARRVFSIGNGQKYKDQLTAKEWQDLIDFEGNANGFFSTYRAVQD
jgi:hypothetical protein